jgi:NADH-quinone oxidoreductase subunit G
MPKLKVDGIEVEVPAGTVIIEAAKLAGKDVPFFCYHDKLSRPANCRQCLVEVAKAPKLVPACYTTVAEGMEVLTESSRVKDVQRSNMEFLLLNHPVDCPICDQAGECKLQNYYRDYDFKPSRLNVLPNHKPKVVRLGAEVVLDDERCILCTRCVRFYEEIVGERPLGVFKRGNKSELGLYPGKALPHGYARNVVDICPVGALTSEDFRFQKRVWFLKRADSICTGCATGCNIHLEHDDGQVWRYRARENEAVNECWLCDDGAYSYHAIHEHRVTAPKVRQSGAWADATWDQALTIAANALRDAGGPVGLVLSAQATVEDNYAWLSVAKAAFGDVRVYAAGKPSGKGDDILRSADQNPNTLGVRKLAPEAKDVAALKADLDGNKLRAVVVLGHEFADLKVLDSLRKSPAVIAVVTHETPILDFAAVVLPGVTHAEKDGVFVNGEGRAQRINAAIEPVGRAAPQWKIALKLGEKLGHVATWAGPTELFDDVAAKVEAFAGLSHAKLGAGGVPLAGYSEPAADQKIGFVHLRHQGAVVATP